MSPVHGEALLNEAARWRLLGLLFERPRPGWIDEMSALAAEVDDERLTIAVREAGGVGEGPYLAAMGPGGTVSPREVGYRPLADPGRILAELNGFYDAFGYAPRVEDPADHVAVEVGFVGFMKLKQAYAVARNDAAARQTTRDATTAFIADHLSVFAGELARRAEGGGLPHLGRAASILHEWCPGKIRSSLAVVGPEPSSLQDDGDGCLDCGGF